MYVDEVGNPDMRHSQERFLSLFGVIVEDGAASEQLEREMLALKQEFFIYDPDAPIIFHRNDLARMNRQFSVLRGWDKAKRTALNDRLLECYKRWQYTAIVVTIDKKAHRERYKSYREPYTYCMKILLERYAMFLGKRNGHGDVMFESRNRKLDDELKSDFRGLHSKGTEHIGSHEWRTRIPSAKLKVVPKTANIAGLQLADLLGHSAHYDVLAEYGLQNGQASALGARVNQVLRTAKYDRGRNGQIQGCGMKLLR